MSQTTTCPNCLKQFAAVPKAIGRKVKCPKCGQPFVVQVDPAPDEDAPPTLADIAASAPAGEEQEWTPIPAPVVRARAKKRTPLNPMLLWGGIGAVALIAIVLAAYALWPHSSGSAVSQSPPPGAPGSAENPIIVDNLEPGHPDPNVNVPTPDYAGMAAGFGADWVARVAIKGTLPGVPDPDSLILQAYNKALHDSGDIYCSSHIFGTLTTPMVAAPVHDINRLVKALLKPAQPSFQIRNDYESRLVFTPESITVDNDQRIITIDLAKATLTPLK